MILGQNESVGGRPVPAVPDHELLRLIGRGSYGEVWLARNIMGALRAVKVIYRGSFDDSRPYEREYSGLKRFEPISRQHPSQIDILHIGRNDTEACFYYVMELADDAASPSDSDFTTYQAKTLKSEMDSRGPLAASECVELGLALSTALAHLHQNGLVHRDIKPSNIIFVNGLPKLADIGLVSPVDATRSYVGTVGYAPYEGPGTPQADIYSLGKVLYEAATGRDRQEFPELPTRIEGTQAQEKEFLELNEVLLKACDDDPRSRYQSAAEMYEDLLALRSGKSLIRLRTTEKRFRTAKRVGAVLVLGFALASSAYFYQARQTKAVTKLARENLQLANAARENAEANRKRLLTLQVANAIGKMIKDEWNPAIMDLVSALRLVKPGSEEDRIHRQRWTSIIENYPRTLHIFLHDHGVIHCAYSPDGSRVASISDAGTNYEFRVYELASERLLVKTQIELSGRRSRQGETLFYSADGKRVILRPAVPEDRLIVLDPIEGRLMESPDIRLLDCIDGRSALGLTTAAGIQLIDLGSGKVLAGPIVNQSPLLGARLNSSNTRFIAVRSASREKESTELEVYDLLKGSMVGSRISNRAGTRIGLTRDGKTVVLEASVSTGRITRLLAENGMEVSAPERGEDFIALVQAMSGLWLVTHDKYRTGSALRNLDTGVETRLPRPKAGLPEYAFSQDGLFASLEENINRLSDGSPVVPQLTQGSWIHCQAFSPNGHELASGSSDRTLRIRDFSVSTAPRLTIRAAGLLTEASFTPDGRSIVTTSGNISLLRAYDTLSGRPITPPCGDDIKLGALRFSPDGQQVVVFTEARALGLGDTRNFGCAVWSLRTNQMPLRWLATNGIVWSAEFSPDARELLLVDDRRASLWEISPTRLLLPLEHRTVVRHACFSPDGAIIATTAADGFVRLWEKSTGKLLREISIREWPEETAFSPDGGVLTISCADESVRFWHLKENRLTPVSIHHPGTPVHVRFVRGNSNFLTFTPSPWIKVWNTSGALLFPTIDQGYGVTSAEFSPDGQFLVSATDKRLAWVWDGRSGEPLRFPITHSGPVSSAHFNGDSTSFLTCGKDAGVRVWDVHRAPSPLSNQELTTLAELWTNLSADDATRPKLTAEEVIERYTRLRQAHPEIFTSDHRAAAAWHETIAGEARDQRLSRAVIFHLTQALALDPDLERSPTADRIFWSRGEEYARLKEYHNALADLERAVRIDPDNIVNWDRWILFLIGSGRFREYSQACSQLVEHFAAYVQNPPSAFERDSKLVYIASLCALGTNDIPPSLCLRLLDGLFEGWQARVLDDRGNALMRAGRFSEALDAYQQMEKTFPSSDLDRCKMFQSDALAHLGKTKEASQTFAESLALHNRKSAAGSDDEWANDLHFAIARRLAEAALQAAMPDQPLE